MFHLLLFKPHLLPTFLSLVCLSMEKPKEFHVCSEQKPIYLNLFYMDNITTIDYIGIDQLVSIKSIMILR